MQQVFINLLVNASDAIGEKGGRINISTDLIKLSPYGITHIKKATCPKRHDLMDNEVKIDGMPSIKLKVSSNGHSGFINLDPVYGRNHHKIPASLEKLDINSKDLKVVCPQCEISLIDSTKKCPDCNSPVYSIEVPSQGNVEGCLSINCDWQKWDAVDVGGQKEYLEIKISDTGCGIPRENLSKIFEPFYSTKGQKGTGLGLSVIWGIIDNHNGTITVDSELNNGTTFTIHLPAGKL
jgi:signal transduction histidine kinase